MGKSTTEEENSLLNATAAILAACRQSDSADRGASFVLVWCKCRDLGGPRSETLKEHIYAAANRLTASGDAGVKPKKWWMLLFLRTDQSKFTAIWHL